MATRKQFVGDMSPDPQLQGLVNSIPDEAVTEEVLREQRVSFAYGNAPIRLKKITKDSIRFASNNIRMR
jgi:hypothetical protein